MEWLRVATQGNSHNTPRPRNNSDNDKTQANCIGYRMPYEVLHDEEVDRGTRSVRGRVLHQGLETNENDDLASPGRTHRHGTTFIVRGLSPGRTSLLVSIFLVEGLGGPRDFRHERTTFADGRSVYVDFICFENTLLTWPTTFLGTWDGLYCCGGRYFLETSVAFSRPRWWHGGDKDKRRSFRLVRLCIDSRTGQQQGKGDWVVVDEIASAGVFAITLSTMS